MQNNYVYLFGGANSGSGLIPMFSSSKGGETAGSVACSTGNVSAFSGTSSSGGETAGSVACSFGSSSSSSGGGSFSTIA